MQPTHEKHLVHSVFSFLIHFTSCSQLFQSGLLDLNRIKILHGGYTILLLILKLFLFILKPSVLELKVYKLC